MHFEIRAWRPEDTQETMEVLKDGSLSNMKPWCALKFKSWTSISCLIAISGISYLWFHSLMAIVLSGVVYLCTLWILVCMCTLYYLYGPPLQDMATVQDVYFKSPDTIFLVAIASNRVVGTIAIVHRSTTDKRTKVAWLRRMAVLRQFRGLGIAKSLIQEAIVFCKTHRYSSIELITTEVHKSARNLYEKMGFHLNCYTCQYLGGWVPVWCYEYIYDLQSS